MRTGIKLVGEGSDFLQPCVVATVSGNEPSTVIDPSQNLGGRKRPVMGLRPDDEAHAAITRYVIEPRVPDIDNIRELENAEIAARIVIAGSGKHLLDVIGECRPGDIEAVFSTVREDCIPCGIHRGTDLVSSLVRMGNDTDMCNGNEPIRPDLAGARSGVTRDSRLNVPR